MTYPALSRCNDRDALVARPVRREGTFSSSARRDGRVVEGLPTSYTLHPTPHTLHPPPYTLHSIPFTSHPTPYTMNPTPGTLHPSGRGGRVVEGIPLPPSETGTA